MFFFYFWITHIYRQGPGNRGAGGPGPPQKLRFYRVKIFKMRKISFSILVGPPLGKNRSQGPVNLHSSLYFLQDINRVICLNPGLENGSNMGKEMQLELMAKMWPIKEPVSQTYGINTFSKIRKYHISIFFSLLGFSSDRNFHLYLFLLYEMKNVKNKFRDLHNMVKC